MLPERKESPSKKYNRISYAAAKSNPVYWQVMENMFNEQAARLVQRNWRKKKDKEYKGKYSETLTGPHSMRFIQEPWGLAKPMEHAEKIKAGKQAELDFKDPEFVRHIYKALRLGYININQMVDALLLHGMKDFFKSTIKRCEYDEKDPFAAYIAFASEENKKSFNERLPKKVPETDRCYFSINLPNKYTAAFLLGTFTGYDGFDFQNQFINHYPKFSAMFESYLNHCKIDETKKAEMMGHLKDLSDADKNKAARDVLKTFIYDQEPDKDFLLAGANVTDTRTNQNKKYPENKDKSNLIFLVALLRVAEEMPALEVSPDYNKSDPDSPILCFNLPTTAVLTQMEYALFGEDDTIDPFFTAGQVSTRMIRYLDEKPTTYGIDKPSRPIELTHPDIAKHKTYHNFDAVDFLVTWHDIFHAWKCGVNVRKSFFRYLIQLEEQVTGFDMSKSIWQLVDRDTKFSWLIRRYENEKDEKNAPSARGNGVKITMELIGNKFWEQTATHDLNLIYVIDMILNYSKWNEKLAGGHPAVSADPKDFSGFLKCYKDMENIIKSDADKNSMLFYILAFRLKDHPEGLALCKELEKIGLDKIFYWKKDSGLYFKLADEGEVNDRMKQTPRDVAVETMTMDRLYKTLSLIKSKINSASMQMETKAASSCQEFKNSRSPKQNLGLFSLMGLKKNKILKYGNNDIEEAIIQANLTTALKSGLTTEDEINKLKYTKLTVATILLNDYGLIALEKKYLTLTQADPVLVSFLDILLTKEGITAFENGMSFEKVVRMTTHDMKEEIKKYAKMSESATLEDGIKNLALLR